ncbi:MAG TPA: DEAD/DEAH box helicase, partial [Candidatus Acidoferrum sp.]
MGIGLPLDGVSVIPTIGIVKLSKLTPVGGVSNIEIDTVALPVGPQLVQGGDDFKPLQEVSATAAVTARNASKPLERMHTPHDRIWRVGQILAFGNPQATVSLCTGNYAVRNVLACSTANCPLRLYLPVFRRSPPQGEPRWDRAYPLLGKSLRVTPVPVLGPDRGTQRNVLSLDFASYLCKQAGSLVKRISKTVPSEAKKQRPQVAPERVYAPLEDDFAPKRSARVTNDHDLIELRDDPTVQTDSPSTPNPNKPSMEQIFGPGGYLDKCMIGGYEHRPAQLEMAQAVDDAFEKHHHVIVEAGTGTGKTLAYLLPAICSGRRVVISTATKSLQEQLYQKDVPFLKKHFAPQLK